MATGVAAFEGAFLIVACEEKMDDDLRRHLISAEMDSS